VTWKRRALLCGFTASLWFTPASAEEGHFRLLIHTVQELGEDGGYGFAGWGLVPNARDRRKQVLVFGPRYTGNKWWIEAMPGVLLEEKSRDELEESESERTTFLLDIRASLDRIPRVAIWTNVEWIEGGSFYVYLEADHRVGEKVTVGLETENFFADGKNALSVGPHLTYSPVKQVKFMVAYQFYEEAESQVWTRMIINF